MPFILFSTIYLSLQFPLTHISSAIKYKFCSNCNSMDKLPTTTSIQVESIVFPPSFKPPGATNTLFLGGAGLRGMEMEGKFVKLTGLGLYLEDKAIPLLAAKWKGKSVEELKDSDEFYNDIITGSFEKCFQVTTIREIPGAQFSAFNVGYWKKLGTCTTDEDAKVAEKFLEVFKDQIFPPGSSIFFTMPPSGSVMISFTKDGIIPEAVNAELEKAKIGQSMIEMTIGKNSVSPETKQSLALRLSKLMC